MSKNTTSGVSLSDLSIGQKAYVVDIRTNGMMRRRLLDLGFVPGTAVVKQYPSPVEDPTVYQVRQTSIALREEDAREVEVQLVPPSGCRRDPETETCRKCPASNGRIAPCSRDSFHHVVALAGNPNTGKSTVFNRLTGLRQHVGNWPGKTVTRAEGALVHGGRRIKLIDLPGTYSLLSSSTEEEIARDFLLFGAPGCTVVVVDATCLERNLNLVFQILEITDRVVVCVNLMDEAERRGFTIDSVQMEEELGVPVVLTAARSGKGMEGLKEKVLGVASGRLATTPARIPLDRKLQKAVDELVPLIEEMYPDIPNARWIALRLIDGGDVRLREEVENGILADPAGRIGDRSLAGMSPDVREIRR